MLIKSSFYFFFPVFFSFHGVQWVLSGESSSILVYLLKLSYVPYILGMMIKVRRLSFPNGFGALVVFFLILVFIFGLVVPLFDLQNINLFYYISDIIGFCFTFLVFSFTLTGLIKEKISKDYLFKIIKNSTLIVSFIIIVYWFLSGGDKVSIPPEIHYGVALCVSAAILGLYPFKGRRMFPIIIILIACILSLQRINVLVVIFSMFFAWLSTLKSLYTFVKKGLILVLFMLPVGYLASEFLEDLISSASFSFSSEQAIEFKDSSANQRILEAILITKELAYMPKYYWIFGKGFGAEYKNRDGLVGHYKEIVHQAHCTFFVVLLRHGFMGVFLFCLIGFLGLKNLMSSNLYSKVYSIGLLCTYLALIFDQYVYWGTLFGISVSTCFYFGKIDSIDSSFDVKVISQKCD